MSFFRFFSSIFDLPLSVGKLFLGPFSSCSSLIIYCNRGNSSLERQHPARSYISHPDSLLKSCLVPAAMSAIPSPAGVHRPTEPHLQHRHYSLTSQPFPPPPPPLQLKPSMQHPLHKPASYPAGANPPVMTLGQKIAQLNEAVWLQIGESLSSV